MFSSVQCMLWYSLHAASHVLCASQCIPHCQSCPTHVMLCCAGAHFVPTCSGEYKQQLVAFLDRFKVADSSAAAAAAGKAKASGSVGSSLASMSLEEAEPQNESAEDAGLTTEAARL